MLRLLTRRFFGALLLGSAAASGCATPTETLGGEDGGIDAASDTGGGSACATDCSMLPASPCEIGVCNEETAECELKAINSGPCDDGLFCTVGEMCKDGVCTGASANPCSEIPIEVCSVPACDEAQKACVPLLLPDGTSCLIDDLCTVNATCTAGVCSGVPKDCFFAPLTEQCHVAVCNTQNGECDPIPGNDGAECTDADDLCNIDKVCAGGVCQGGVPKCAFLNVGCTNGVCDPATGDCSGQVVGVGEVCLEGTDDCNTGVCQNDNTCLSMAADDGIPCSDKNSCTGGDICSAGACSGTPPPDYEVYFSETFADNAAGWTIGMEWAIGPAMASPGTGTFGFYEDPGFDHTPTIDDGIAGVVLGGYADVALHPMYYLESPPFDASAMGSVYLQFWRVLNSDFFAYMNNVIEIYDGATWQPIWESGAFPPSDETWVFISYDITQLKSANMRVRFGFDVGLSNAAIVGSWNIDDVVVSNKVCP